MKRAVPALSVLVVVGLLSALLVRAFSDPVPVERLSMLRQGMTPGEVEVLLGPPAMIYDSGQWTYRRPLVFGFVNIHWQEDGTYDGEINFERY